MVQAEQEANKAVGGNEMVRTSNLSHLVIFIQLNLRIKSLKNQLDISESELDLAQTEKRKFQEENLDKDRELQVSIRLIFSVFLIYIIFSDAAEINW